MKKNKKTQEDQQLEFNKKADSFFRITFWLAAICFTLGVFISIFIDIFDWAGKKLENNDSKKQECLDRTFNVKNEFTAKKIYKKCMNE
jgi:hypothetical protein